jgi:hypothetical protein
MLCGGVNTARTGRCADLWDAYSSCTAPLPQWGSHTGQQRAHRACNCSQRSSRHHSRHHSRLAARSSRATVPGVDATHDRTCSTSYRGGLVAPLPTISNVAAAAAAAAVLLTCQPVLATPQQQQPWQQQPVCPVTDVAALFGGGEEVERDPVEVRAGCGCRLWVQVVGAGLWLQISTQLCMPLAERSPLPSGPSPADPALCPRPPHLDLPALLPLRNHVQKVRDREAAGREGE